MQENNLLSLSYGRIIERSIDAAEGLLPESFETYQIVEPGNIVMRLTDLQNDWRSLRQGLVTQRGIITSAYDALQVSTAHDPRFWAYSLLALDLAKYYYSMGGGVRQSIKFADFPNDWIAAPDTETQKTIADFLDSKTAKIDKLIEQKQQLVKLADEKRSTLITAAVNGQIDTQNGKWLAFEGRCDKAVMRLRHMVRLGPSPMEVQFLCPTDEVTFAPMDALADGLGGLDASRAKPLSEVVNGSYNYFSEGDVLLAKVTPCFENGKKAIAQGLSNGVGFATSEVHVIRPDRKKIDTQFLRFLLCAEDFRAGGIRSMTGAGGLRRVSENGILDYRPKTTDLETQKDIADFLAKETTRIDALKTKTLVSINLLREHRSALITASVTGQIDVATWRKRGQTDRNLDAIEQATPA